MPVLQRMTAVAAFLGERGHILRSGGAGGADMAFETGCDHVNGPKEIYTPWDGFSQRRRTQRGVIVLGNHIAAQEIAAKAHPNWAACSNGAKLLHTRNVYQVLGQTLDKPADFVLCYTKNGSGAGGTGQALRIAKAHQVLCIDLGAPTGNDSLIALLKQLK